MIQLVREDTGGEKMVSTLQIDGELDNASMLTVDAVDALDYLEPCGAGNPRPVFALRGVNITCMADVGGGRHLKMRAARDGKTMDLIFFSVTREQSGLMVGDRADVAFYPQINEFRGSRSVQLHLVDLRPAVTEQQRRETELYRRFRSGAAITPAQARVMIPQREEFAGVWRYVAHRQGEIVATPTRLARQVAQEAALPESILRTLICLDVMEELGLVQRAAEKDGSFRLRLRQRREKGKVDLYQASAIQKLQAIAWGGKKDA